MTMQKAFPARARLAAAFALLVILALPAPPAIAQAPPSSGYRIGPRDLIEIRVQELEELNGPRRVLEDGSIDLPHLGSVKAQGLTQAELAESLKRLLEGSLLQRASVSVEVKEYRSQPISVIGAVTRPGNLDFSGRWTLIEALTAAGGLAPSHGNLVHVIRRAGNGLSDQLTIELDDLLVRADPKVNIPIFANDLINVPATIEITVYCLGEVGQPGALSFKSTERITLLAAIARAGGLSDRAANKIVIKRQGRSGAAQEITVDYKRIVSGKDPDVALEQGDVVVVKESFF